VRATNKPKERSITESRATASLVCDPRTFVQSLERGLAVLRVFGADAPALTLADVARRAELTRATARRILHTLHALGYVATDGKTFELTPKVLDLGYAYLSSMHLGDIAQPTMEALSEHVHESVSLAMLEGDDIVYVARVPTKRIMTISLGLGSRLPAHCTSMGRVLLADLPPAELDAYLCRARLVARTERTVTDPEVLRAVLVDVRAKGWALLDQELEDGVRSVAAPVRDRSGRAVAALNIGTQAARVTLQQLRADLVPALLDAAATISRQLAKR
jgi:IclR family transcriptional regulator, pca regulon regulatory protein